MLRKKKDNIWESQETTEELFDKLSEFQSAEETSGHFKPKLNSDSPQTSDLMENLL